MPQSAMYGHYPGSMMYQYPYNSPYPPMYNSYFGAFRPGPGGQPIGPLGGPPQQPFPSMQPLQGALPGIKTFVNYFCDTCISSLVLCPYLTKGAQKTQPTPATYQKEAKGQWKEEEKEEASISEEDEELNKTGDKGPKEEEDREEKPGDSAEVLSEKQESVPISDELNPSISLTSAEVMLCSIVYLCFFF